MPLNSAFINHLQQQLTEIKNNDVVITRYTTVSGGSINAAYCLHTSGGKYMLKVNSKVAYPDMFRLEHGGLRAIQTTNTVAVPETIMYGEYKDDSYLVLEWIEAGKNTTKSATHLGQQLAAMHRHTAPQFGFEHNNYMGSLPQSNRQHTTWSSFFMEERLQPMVKIGRDKKLLSATDITGFDQLYHRLSNLFSEEPPSLIHGDLWSGNYLIDESQQPYLIDPAVSYGHREFDIAMTTLFGGFASNFYQAYREAYPLAEGWQQRIGLWNLYPLLLHLNLFGNSYLGQVRTALQQYL